MASSPSTKEMSRSLRRNGKTNLARNRRSRNGDHEGGQMEENISPGRYRHYKGNEYSVLGVARHSETLEELVVYRQEYGEHGLWVRPKAMFMETVIVNGQKVPRFQHMPSKEGEKNLFTDLPTQLPQELVQTLLTAAQVRIE